MNYDKINLTEYLNVADGDQETFDILMTETIKLLETVQTKYPKAMHAQDYSLVQTDCHNLKPVLEMLKVKDLANVLIEGKALITNKSSEKEAKQKNMLLLDDMIDVLLAQLETVKTQF